MVMLMLMLMVFNVTVKVMWVLVWRLLRLCLRLRGYQPGFELELGGRALLIHQYRHQRKYQ